MEARDAPENGQARRVRARRLRARELAAALVAAAPQVAAPHLGSRRRNQAMVILSRHMLAGRRTGRSSAAGGRAPPGEQTAKPGYGYSQQAHATALATAAPQVTAPHLRSR